MSITRLACSPGVLLAVAVLAALATFGIPWHTAGMPSRRARLLSQGHPS